MQPVPMFNVFWLAVVGGIVWISGYRRWRSTQWSWDLQGTSWERWGRQDYVGIHLYSLIDCMLLLVYILSRDKWMSTLMTTELFTMQQQPLSSLLGFVEIILMIIMTRSRLWLFYYCSSLRMQPPGSLQTSLLPLDSLLHDHKPTFTVCEESGKPAHPETLTMQKC